MADLENEIIDSEEIIEEDQETTTDEITYDDYLALLERNKKAEAKLVEYKKKEKENTKTVQPVKADTELRLFFVENPEAKQYKDTILGLRTNAKYSAFELEELLDIAKIKAPTQSKTKTEFDLRGQKKPKTLESMSEEEAVEKLSPTEFLKWSRANGFKN